MPNVAVIVLDSLRKDAFDRHFEWLPGRRFENTWSPSHWTVPAHAALFTGKYASEVGVRVNNESLDCSEKVLAEALSENGYTTRAFSENPLLTGSSEFDRGFDEFVLGGRAMGADSDVFDWSKAAQSLPGSGRIRDLHAVLRCLLGDNDTIRSLRYGWKVKTGRYDDPTDGLKTIKATDFGGTEFLFCNFMTAHLPYFPPDSYRTVGTDEYDPNAPNRMLGNEGEFSGHRQAYDDAVRYLSDSYRDIFEELQSSFEYVITLGDHGELFGEHGFGGHWHGVYPQLTHVPLVVSDTTGTTEHCTETTSLLDVHQTVLSVAGIDAESRGRDLRSDLSGRTYLAECHGLREGRMRFLESEGWLEAEIRKLDTEYNGIATPDGYYGYESADGFVGIGSTDMKTPAKKLRELVQSLDKREPERTETTSTPDSVEQHLQDLGYL